MSFEAAKCPSCNASIQVPSDREKAVCMFCGNILVVKDAIQKLKVELNGPIVVDSNIETIIKSAHGFITLKKWDDAMRLFEKVIEQDSTDYRGWWGKFLVRSKNMTLSPRRLKETDDPETADVSDYEACQQFAPADEKERLALIFKEYKEKNRKTCLLTVGRPNEKTIIRRTYLVWINRQPLAKLEKDEEVTIELFPGNYAIRVTNENPLSSVPLLGDLGSMVGVEAIIELDCDSYLTLYMSALSGLQFKIEGGKILRKAKTSIL